MRGERASSRRDLPQAAHALKSMLRSNGSSIASAQQIHQLLARQERWPACASSTASRRNSAPDSDIFSAVSCLSASAPSYRAASLRKDDSHGTSDGNGSRPRCEVRRRTAVNAREQLARLERLRHIVVGAELESEDLGLTSSLRAVSMMNRHLRAGAQLAAQSEPIVARQHDVEHDQVHVRAARAHGASPCRRANSRSRAYPFFS